MAPNAENRSIPALHLLHCWLPVAVGWSIAEVMHRSTGAAFSAWGMTLLLAGIGAAYTVDRLLDPPPLPRPFWLRRTLWIAAGLFVGISLCAAGKMPIHVQVSAILLGAISLAYPGLKRLPLAKTAAVALAWTWAGTTLPFAAAEPAHWWRLDVAAPLLLILAANGILCDLKDCDPDRRKGVPTLPLFLGARRTCLVVTAMLLVSVALSLAQHRPGLALTGAALALAAQFPTLLASEGVGPLIADAILILPGLLIYTGAV